jgi:beta-galactosidase
VSPGLATVTRGRLLFGGDYNPEQWPEETWQEDVRLMREAGVTSVTVGVFSWSRLEPRPGVFDFGWLDRVMDLLHAHGVGVVLATPTASPPPWLGRLHPDTLPVDEDGRTEFWGGRQHFSHSSAVYRRHAATVTEALAARYAGHPALTMWHINNEYCTYDHGDEAAARFRTWLKRRHGTLDALNTAWGTAFWSQGYGDWQEILPPRRTHYLKNPAQVLDFRRFTSDMLLECFTAERDIVRRHTPHLPVTTNFMPLFFGQDGWRWAEEEDVVSVDLYPDPCDPLGGQEGALVQDLTRSQAGGGPWMVM